MPFAYSPRAGHRVLCGASRLRRGKSEWDGNEDFQPHPLRNRRSNEYSAYSAYSAQLFDLTVGKCIDCLPKLSTNQEHYFCSVVSSRVSSSPFSPSLTPSKLRCSCSLAHFFFLATTHHFLASLPYYCDFERKLRYCCFYISRF